MGLNHSGILFQPHCKGTGETFAQVGKPWEQEHSPQDRRIRDGVQPWIKAHRCEDLPLPFVAPNMLFPADLHSLPPAFGSSNSFLLLLSISW